MWTAEKDVWLTKDDKPIYEGDANYDTDVASLLVRKGMQIPLEKARKYGLVSEDPVGDVIRSSSVTFEKDDQGNEIAVVAGAKVPTGRKADEVPEISEGGEKLTWQGKDYVSFEALREGMEEFAKALAAAESILDDKDDSTGVSLARAKADQWLTVLRDPEEEDEPQLVPAAASQAKPEGTGKDPEPATPTEWEKAYGNLPGLNVEVVASLQKAGCTDRASVAKADDKSLIDLPNIGKVRVSKWREALAGDKT